MYSYEIDQTIKSQNYHISPEIYLHICNTSPQIVRVKYDPYNENFNIWTDDNCNWIFKINLRGQK